MKLKSVFTINYKDLAAMSSSISAVIRAAFGNYDVVHIPAEGSCGNVLAAETYGKACCGNDTWWCNIKHKNNAFTKRYILEKMAILGNVTLTV